jgi:site-specific DNA-methyltransferase (adenine-specific)
VNGNNGAFQSNIIEDIPKNKHSDYNVHCTVKPLALMEKLVAMLTPPSEEHIVLDPFAGSGTTLVAAKKLGRGFAGIEIVPEYIEIIERRLAEIEDTGDRKVTARSCTLELWPEGSL